MGEPWTATASLLAPFVPVGSAADRNKHPEPTLKKEGNHSKRLKSGPRN